MSNNHTVTKNPPLASPRILSVQSHVVSGYCGNKSAVFPLQLLEFEVDVINSVQLSNHTQYKVAKGQKFSGQDLSTLHEGLAANNLLSLYDFVLSGYIGDFTFVQSLSKLIADIKKTRADNGLKCSYTFDPVLGDDATGFYVPDGERVADNYKKLLLPLADIITPNRFEVSALTGVEIDTSSSSVLDQALEAVKALHAQGPKIVVITSMEADIFNGQLVCILSHKPDDNGTYKSFMIKIPKFDCAFTGTGDLFAALLTGWLHKTSYDLKISLENTVNSIHDVLTDTYAYYCAKNDNTVLSHELRLVQNKEHILRPSNRFQAEPMN